MVIDTILLLLGFGKHSANAASQSRHPRDMLEFVTIAARRRAYWSLFLAACLCLALFIPLFSRVASTEEAPAFLQKAGVVFTYKLGALPLPSYRLAAVGIGLCTLYAALTLGLIVFNFRKTASSEIFFYSFWVLSVGLEILRLLLYSLAADGASLSIQILGARALVFTRYVGYFSLFLSGLYAAGFRNEKIGMVVVMILAVALGLAASIPVDTGAFTATLELRPGYAEVNSILAFVTGAVTVANFLYAAHNSAEPAYRAAAFGSGLFFIGQRLLISVWNPYLLVFGFLLLALGSAIFVYRLHNYYLWQ